MRNIIKITILVLCGIYTVSTANAQLLKRPRVLLFANGAYASPSNDEMKKAYKNGVAVEFGGGIGFGKTMLVGTIGYQAYSNISNLSGIPNGTLKVNPLKIGIRQTIIGPLFVLGNGGVAIQSYSKSDAKSSNFIYELGGGLKLGLFEFQLTHNSWKQPGASANSSALLFKGGLAFKL